MTTTLRAAIVLALLSALPLRAATAAEEREFKIAPQALSQALVAFSEQSQLVVTAASELLAGKSAPMVSGQMRPEKALEKLLEGTGLKYVQGEGGDLSVVLASDKPTRTGGKPTADVGSDGMWRVAQVQGATTESTADAEPAKLEEIVVTAQKKLERLQDVPVPVTALDAQGLANNNQLRLQDYYATVPGLGMTVNYNGAPSVTIRGLSTGNQTNPTVGIVVDDVPYGSSTALGGGFFVPDIDPSELSRIEVLRGPQGTLYGASSLGGLIKYVTLDPSTDGVRARVQGGLNSVKNGDDLGYSVRGSVNVPLSDTFAFRASGFTRQDAGYIDNVLTGKNGVNEVDVDGGRLAALWTPSDATSVRFSALFQDTKVHGSPDAVVAPGLNDLEQNNVAGTGQHDTKIQTYRLSLNTKLGNADFTSVSGYSEGKNTGATDLSIIGFFTGLAQANFGVNGTALLDDIRTSKFTQEFRLAARASDRWEWLLGAFFTDENSHYNQAPTAIDTTTGEIAGVLDSLSPKISYKEYAAFADLTVHFNDRFDIQFGARESRIKQNYALTIDGVAAVDAFGLPPDTVFPLVQPTVHTKDSAFTYLLTPRFRLNDDLMVYARLASGYRPGGPNTNTTLNALPTYDPDKTQNYEVGIKGETLEGRISFDASAYYIDWKDIQVQLFDPDTLAAIYVNTGRGKSEGVELAFDLKPLPGLSISPWVAWNHATLTEDFPAASLGFGQSGDRLPYSARFSGSLSIEQSFSLPSNMTGFVGGSISYVGDRRGIFISPTDRQTFGAYAQTDLRAGITRESWNANLFVNNLTDRRGVLTGGLDNINPAAFNYIQPRTIGLSLAKSF